MTEREFQKKLKDELKERFPGCLVLKADPNDIQGIPDLLVLYQNKWASLEVKKSASATHRPGQDYYVKTMDTMSFSSFIFPENKEDVLDAMERSFQGHTRRSSRPSKPKQTQLD